MEIIGIYLNLMLMDIYFDDLRITSLEESKADEISSLVSDVGGQLGLWELLAVY